MAGQPHDVSGHRCVLCGFVFTKKTPHALISRKIGHFIVNVKVCNSCKCKQRKGELHEELENYFSRNFGVCVVRGCGITAAREFEFERLRCDGGGNCSELLSQGL